MTLWENLRKKITAIIDLPIEAVQSQQPRLAPSGVSPSAQYVYPPQKRPQNSLKTRVLREAATTNYSHGLEKIYALETVDPKTIRVIGGEEEKKRVESPFSEPLLELDLGPAFRDWITPCFWQEPIQVLGLSSQAEKMLAQQGWLILKDLLVLQRSSLVHIKGFGQGHIDELFHKLQQYVNGRSERISHTIQWDAWLRNILSQLPLKEAKILAETYGLGEAIHIPPYLSGEIRRMSVQDKKGIAKNALDSLRQSPGKENIATRWKEILDAFLVPWVRLRRGFAHEEEIEERLNCVAEDSSRGIAFLKDLLGKTKIYGDVLIALGEKTYAVDQYHAEFYSKVLAVAQTYFYKHTVHYSLSELSHLIMRELVRSWITCDLSSIETTILLSPCFRTFKDKEGKLSVALAWN